MLPSPADGCSHESSLWLIFNVGYHVGTVTWTPRKAFEYKSLQCLNNPLPLHI